MDELTVIENVSYPLQIYELGETIIESKVNAIVKKFHLEAIADKKVKTLSAGEKQKVCLARALIHDPEFIIADEPTGNLDRESTQGIADTLIQSNIA